MEKRRDILDAKQEMRKLEAKVAHFYFLTQFFSNLNQNTKKKQTDLYVRLRDIDSKKHWLFTPTCLCEFATTEGIELFVSLNSRDSLLLLHYSIV